MAYDNSHSIRYLFADDVKMLFNKVNVNYKPFGKDDTVTYKQLGSGQDTEFLGYWSGSKLFDTLAINSQITEQGDKMLDVAADETLQTRRDRLRGYVNSGPNSLTE